MDRFPQRRSNGMVKSYHGSTGQTTNLSALKSDGIGQITKQVDVSKKASNCSCRCNPLNEENSGLFGSRRISSKQASGTPMKMLIDEEMSREMELRRRSPNVVARLMGLDALPPQQPVRKQQNKISENYFQTATSMRPQDNYMPFEDHWLHTDIQEPQEFKDVFEVLETPKVAQHDICLVRKGKTRTKPREINMEMTRQKFIDKKHHSIDKKLHKSKEFNDTLEVLGSSTDLFLQFLQEPNSLFTKHAHNLQAVSLPPQSTHIEPLRSLHNSKYGDSGVCWKSDRKTERCAKTQKGAIKSLEKHRSGPFSDSHNKRTVHRSHKLPKSRLKEKAESCLSPTRIVVLKPGLGNVQNTPDAFASANSLASSQSNYKKYRKFRRSRNHELYAEVRDRQIFPNNAELTKNRSKGSREIAREITRRVRDVVSSSRSIKISNLGLNGYAGDESSCSLSDSECIYNFEACTSTSKHFNDWNNRCDASSSYSSESSVSREAKKRLSERWKMTHKFQEVGLIGSGPSTLGEMLALPDREPGLTTLDSIICKDASTDRLSANKVVGKQGCPSGISSRDGWKNGSCRDLPRSKTLGYGNSLMLKEVINLCPDKSFKGKFSHQIEGSLRNIKFSSKRSQSFLSGGVENNQPIREIHAIPYETRNRVKMTSASKQNESLTGSVSDARQPSEHITVECEEFKMPSETHEGQLPEPTSCITDGGSAAYDKGASITEEMSLDHHQAGSLPSHCCISQQQSPGSSKDAEQPSPVSVLEPPFVEETPSSECFKSISADLDGLRMQLKLLKLESADAYTESSEVSISNEDMRIMGEFSGMYRNLDNIEFSFLLDVLVESGIDSGGNEKALSAMCYSSEFPVGLNVFNKLEKQYSRYVTWLKSERRLLFDLINLVLLEILRPCINRHPWVKPSGGGGVWVHRGFAQEVWGLLIKRMESRAEVLQKEREWLELGDEVDVIGNEMESLLMNELIEEVVFGDLCGCEM